MPKNVLCSQQRAKGWKLFSYITLWSVKSSHDAFQSSVLGTKKLGNVQVALDSSLKRGIKQFKYPHKAQIKSRTLASSGCLVI
jgi:hypothetical protein